MEFKKVCTKTIYLLFETFGNSYSKKIESSTELAIKDQKLKNTVLLFSGFWDFLRNFPFFLCFPKNQLHRYIWYEPNF